MAALAALLQDIKQQVHMATDVLVTNVCHFLWYVQFPVS